MNLIEMVNDKEIIYDDFVNREGERQRVTLSKSMLNGATDQYFLKLYLIQDGILINQGYIYFYLNDTTKTSKFIGIYIKPEYRNKGLASFLVANWIELCLNNGYDFLKTHKKQRKPFLLYLLKTYGFEIMDKSYYKTSPHVIDICEDKKSKNKYLLFKNPGQGITFMRGKIAFEDNYVMIDELKPGMRYLDSILLSSVYNLDNYPKAEEKSNLVRKRQRG